MQDTTSNNKRIAKNTIMLYIRMFISMVVGLYTSRVVLATLGVEDYGIYGVVGGVVGMMGFLNASMSGATSRFLTFELGKGDKERLAKTFSSALIVHIAIAIIVFILAETVGLWFLCNKLNIPEGRMEAAHWVYQFSILATMLSITQVPYNATIIAHEKMDVYAYMEILNVTLKLLIVYLLTIGDFDKLKLYAVLTFAVSLIIMMIYRIYCLRHFKESRFHWVWDKTYLTPLLSFSGWSIYGDIAYTNADINPGEFAAELVSSQLTQRLLSAKHLLETKIDEIVWTDGFFDIFEVQDNEIKLIPDINVKGATLEIDPNDIILENEDDDYSDNPDIILYNEYVQKFTIHGNNKDVKINKEISSAAGDALYISNTLNSIIKSKAIPVDDKIVIPLSALVDKTIFYIKIKNNELSKAMETLKDILDKNGVTLRMDRNQIMQAYIDAAIDGGITMAAVHGEILIMNQIRAADNILETVDWSEPHAPYQVTTLRRALMYNPSATITLSYQDLSKVLYSPLTFKKRGVSFLDLFFMKTPQQFIKSSDALVSNKEFKSDVETNGKPLFTFLSPDRAPKVDDTNI